MSTIGKANRIGKEPDVEYIRLDLDRLQFVKFLQNKGIITDEVNIYGSWPNEHFVLYIDNENKIFICDIDTFASEYDISTSIL